MVDSDDPDTIIEGLQPVADIAVPRCSHAFPPGHLTRLRALKRRYDPAGLLRGNFYIDPDDSVA